MLTFSEAEAEVQDDGAGQHVPSELQRAVDARGQRVRVLRFERLLVCVCAQQRST